MKDKFTVWLQERMLSLGFNPGTIDGIPGRNTTTALKGFQRAHKLPETGVADVATVSLLQAKARLNPPPKQDLYSHYPWMALALRKKGLIEGRDNQELREFLKSDGKTLGDPSKLPWCGDFVETCIALALQNEALPTNPYLARNWTKFGKASEPGFGTVLVFWRTHKTKSTNGHVGFYVGEDDLYYYVLGGNQSNSVSIAKISKKRLLEARAPLTFSSFKAQKVRMTASGPVSSNEV